MNVTQGIVWIKIFINMTSRNILMSKDNTKAYEELKSQKNILKNPEKPPD